MKPTPIFNSEEEAYEYAKKQGLKGIFPQSFTGLATDDKYGYTEYLNFVEKIVKENPEQIEYIKNNLEDDDYLRICEIAIKKDPSILAYVDKLKKNTQMSLDEKTNIDGYSDFLKRILKQNLDETSFERIMIAINKRYDFVEIFYALLEIIKENQEYFKNEIIIHYSDSEYKESNEYIKGLMRKIVDLMNIYADTRHKTNENLSFDEFREVYEFRTFFSSRVGTLERICQIIRCSIMEMRRKIYGDDIGVKDIKVIENLDYYEGKICCTNIENLENFTFPKKFKGYMFFYNLENIKNVTFPEEMQGDIAIGSLKTIENSSLPKKIEGSIELPELTKMKQCNLPVQGYGKIYIPRIELFDLEIPKEYNGTIITKYYNFDNDGKKTKTR